MWVLELISWIHTNQQTRQIYRFGSHVLLIIHNPLNLVRLASFEIIEDFVECDSTSCVLVLFSTGQPKVVNTIWVKSAPFSTAWRVHDVLCLPSIELVQASDISVSATLDTLAVSPWVTSVVEFRLGSPIQN